MARRDAASNTAAGTIRLLGRARYQEATEVAGRDDSQLKTPGNADESARTSVWTRVGVVLLGFSVLLWVPLPVLPFLPLSTGTKAAMAGGLVVGAEIAFWIGVAMAGPEAGRRTRSWIRNAFRRRR